MKAEELKRLDKIDPIVVLSQKIEPIGTEYELAKHELALMRTIKIGERDIEIPGLKRATNTILSALAEFKEKEKRTVMPLQLAKSDDIVIMALRPEHIAANFSYEKDITLATGKYVGIFDILPPTSGVFTLAEKTIIVVTDIIELGPDARLTGIQMNVDGVLQYAIDTTLMVKASDMQIIELPHPAIAHSTLDIDGKLEAKTAGSTVTTFAFPVGVWIGLGKDVPALARP